MNSGETVTFHGAGYINHLMVESCRQMMRLAPKEVTLFHWEVGDVYFRCSPGDYKLAQSPFP